MTAIAPNWDDVLRRAGAQRRRAQRRVAAAVVCSLVVVAGTAVAARNLFHGTKPRPALQRVIREMIPPDPVLQIMGRQSPHVIASRAHGLVELRTHLGTVRLWNGPLSTGGRCLIISGPRRHDVSGGCIPANARVPAIVAGGFDLDTSGDMSRARWIYDGEVRVPASTVELELGHGGSVKAQLVEGAFLVAIPRGKQPVAAVARGRSGRVVARVSLVPKIVPHAPPRKHHPLLTDANFRPVLGFDPHAGYPYVTLWIGRPPYRDCYRISYGVGTPINTCVDPAHTRLKLEALRRDGGPFLLSGYAGRRGASSLEIRFANHVSRRIALHHGFLLAELPRGAHPTVVVARNADGRVVWTRPFAAIIRRR